MNSPTHNAVFIVTTRWLRDNPDCIFVFGDNLLHAGKGGAAALRDLPNTYGFVTKRAPCMADDCFFRPTDYLPVYEAEMAKLHHRFVNQPTATVYVSKLGGGLANRFGIWEKVIRPRLVDDLRSFWDRTVFLF